MTIDAAMDKDDLAALVDEGCIASISPDGSSLRLSDVGIELGLAMADLFNRAFGDWIDTAGVEDFPDWPRESVQAFRFRFELKGCDCWREVIVPGYFTFGQFHQLIQASFLWLDYHRWNFKLHTGGRKVNIEDIDVPDVPDVGLPADDLFSFASGSLPLYLDEVFPRTKNAVYRYDYADRWEVRIHLEENIEHYNEIASGMLPRCVNGHGDAPPEDVGGPAGFSELKRILRGPISPDRVKAQRWAEGQGFEPFSLNQVNTRIAEWDTHQLEYL